MNNMKKRMNWLLMVVLVCGLSLSVTSCKDDDDDNKSEEQQQQEQEAQASKFWSVVGQLVSSADYTDDYQDKTFEPTYGIADATNETTRIVPATLPTWWARRTSTRKRRATPTATPRWAR